MEHGAYNAQQQSDVHSYWEFKLSRHELDSPAYELPFTVAFQTTSDASEAFEDGEIGKLQSIVPARDRKV